MEQNPYNLIFGKEPPQSVPRAAQSMEIIQSLCSDNPNQIYIITGVRGSGKTVFMTEIAKQLEQMADWVVVDLNPEKDLLESLASKLANKRRLAGLFQNAGINLSFFGFGLDIKGTQPITDIEVAISKMLARIKKAEKRVLITIDEAVSTKHLRVFAHTFQSLIREDLPVCLLMTGLYENIHTLQNEKSLTFLYRAPKMELKPLNMGSIASNYQEVFGLEREAALEMANMTKGYSFAFQVLGYFTWQKNGRFRDAIEEYVQYLEEYVYEKIWDEMSAGDRKLAYAIAKNDSGRIIDIRKSLDISTNQFNPYRNRLIKKGILDGSKRGVVDFALPYFERYVLENYYE